MKAMAILGSPRKKGNSSLLAQRFLASAEAVGAETVSYRLQDLNYSGCVACGACKTTSERCVINDDLTKVLEYMSGADIIIYATPNYFGDVSGQFKLFLDRTYSLLKPDFNGSSEKSRLPAGKQLVFILTQGAPADFFESLTEKYSGLQTYFGFDGFHVIRGGNLLLEDQLDDFPKLTAQLDELAQQLLG